MLAPGALNLDYWWMKLSGTLENADSIGLFLASGKSNGITGKLISAVWDPWKELIQHKDILQQSDIYTLRRIIPEDRGYEWGKNNNE